MLIRLKENYLSDAYGLINEGCVLHFPEKLTAELLNKGVAEPVKAETQKEFALKP